MKIDHKNRLIIILTVAACLLAGCAAQGPYLKLEPSLQKDIKTFNNVEYLPLIRLCEAYNLKCRWDPFIKTATIERGSRHVVLRVGSDRILANGEEARLDRPAILNGGVLFVPASFVKSNPGYIIGARQLERLPEAAGPGRFAIRTVVIDAGHGGKDPGARGGRTRVKEKVLTLRIAKQLKNILEDKGIKVIMTREDDRFIPLPRRVDIANKSNADLFVSIHINASRSRSLTGFECYYLSDATDDNARALAALENAPLKIEGGNLYGHSRGVDATLWDMALTENRVESAELAGHICGSIQENIAIKNGGIRSARFYVLKGTRMPAVLVEMGYISNRYEEAKLKDDSFSNQMINAVAQGILSYKRKYENTEGFTKS